MSAGPGDYYAILGVKRDASESTIKRAYYAAARRFHPDKNLKPGETELFLEVQRAYEVLSNPERRSQYDATLQQEQTSPAPLTCAVTYSRQDLCRLDEAQLIYAMVEVAPTDPSFQESDPPLNLCLVLDRSTSMTGEKMDLAKAAAIRIVEMLRPEDLFSLVVFSDRAEVLISAGYRRDPKQTQSRIQAIQPAGATEILRGLEAGIDSLRRGYDPNHGNHLILLTDGHTYGDELACLKLATSAARMGITLSGFGIGSDWNDAFVDELVGRTGGNSTYILRPQEIEDLLARKFEALTKTLIDDVVLKPQASEGVELTYGFRIQPEGGPLRLEEDVHLGPIEKGVPLRVLFEFTIQPPATRTDEAIILDSMLEAVTRKRAMPLAATQLRMSAPVSEDSTGGLPPNSMMAALSTLALYRLQERARQEAQAGEFQAATRHLTNLAGQLEAQGKHRLAKTALLEAQNLERTQSLSDAGGKEIKYGTRALLLPSPEPPA